MIWTHHLKNITYNAAFVPAGALSTETYDGSYIFFVVFPDSLPNAKELSNL